ncbi:hypothetical protein, partial [Tessaracoccus sp. OH4464_COT-324]|uniref:hypothetical protein n=1 Tax=Tessaracoccus sp. OH4464_COT-324 TaxID=2491059 RepID=UPI00131A3D4D
TLPKLFNGLPIDQFNHPETLGNLPLNPQASFITIYNGRGIYGGSGTYDKNFALKVGRGLSNHENYIMAVKSMVDPQHYGRLTCGHDKTYPRQFSCVAYGEDAFIQGESSGVTRISDEEIIAMTNEYLDHALNARNP